nr:MAG TPA: hypothetical protein [Caudoviricetes sp.]
MLICSEVLLHLYMIFLAMIQLLLLRLVICLQNVII